MFADPVKITFNGETAYDVKLLKPLRLGEAFEYTHTGITPTTEHQEKFNSMKLLILTELTKHNQIFRQAPRLEMLEAITPLWGFITKGDNQIALSPYTYVQPFELPQGSPCFVDFELLGLIVSRSTIRPSFKYVITEQPRNVIDFDWGDDSASEVEEVSDIPAAAGSESINLRDPASVRKAMLEEKERIRNAFRSADAAKLHAEEMAARFYDQYDVSDSESAFSEWISDHEDFSESDSE